MMKEWLQSNVVALVALVLSGVALFMNHRTSRRQKREADPAFTYWMTSGWQIICLKNVGKSPAFGVSVEAVRGSTVFWETQIKHVPARSGAEGTEAIWPETPNCNGEKKDILPTDEYVRLFLGRNHDPDEVLLVRCKNYNGDILRFEKRLREIGTRKG